jgi:hypothetical protein
VALSIIGSKKKTPCSRLGHKSIVPSSCGTAYNSYKSFCLPHELLGFLLLDATAKIFFELDACVVQTCEGSYSDLYALLKVAPLKGCSLNKSFSINLIKLPFKHYYIVNEI